MNRTKKLLFHPRTFLILILLISGLLRFIHLDLDPPLQMGLHFISDEGWWVHNARNKALFGEWVLDDFNQSLLVSPLFCFATWVVYHFAGVSILTSRIVPALSGLLSVLVFAVLFYVLSNREHPAGNALHKSVRWDVLGTLLAGSGFAFVSLNRIAFIDSTAFLFVLITWLILERFPHSRIGIFSAGIFCAVSIGTKSYALSLFPVLFLLYFFRLLRNPKKPGEIFRNVFIFFLGGVFSACIWYLTLFLPFQDQFRIMYSLWRSGNIPAGMHEVIHNIPSLIARKDFSGIHISRFLNLNMLLICLAIWRIMTLLTHHSGSLKDFFRNISSIDGEAILWLALVVCIVAPLKAKPFRRYIFWYPPLIILAARSVLPVRKDESGQLSMSLQSIQWITFIGFTILPGALFVYNIGTQIAFQDMTLRKSILVLGIISLAIVIIDLILLAKNSFQVPCFRALNPYLIAAFFIFWQGFYYVNAALNSHYSLRDTSIALGKTYFKPGTLVLGGIADTLCLNNQARAIAIWGREENPHVLNENPVKRFHPDFIVILKEIDGHTWGSEKRYTKYLKPENLLRELNLIPCGEGKYRVKGELYRAPGKVPLNSVVTY